MFPSSLWEELPSIDQSKNCTLSLRAPDNIKFTCILSQRILIIFWGAVQLRNLKNEWFVTQQSPIWRKGKSFSARYLICQNQSMRIFLDCYYIYPLAIISAVRMYLSVPAKSSLPGINNLIQYCSSRILTISFTNCVSLRLFLNTTNASYLLGTSRNH